MEIRIPSLMEDEVLKTERFQVIREMSRLAVYLNCINDEIVYRTPELPESNLLKPRQENIRGLFE